MCIYLVVGMFKKNEYNLIKDLRENIKNFIILIFLCFLGYILLRNSMFLII